MAHAINLNAYAPARAGLIARVRAALADYREFTRTRDELDAMSDAHLADIGLSRHNIRDVAREAVYGR